MVQKQMVSVSEITRLEANSKLYKVRALDLWALGITIVIGGTSNNIKILVAFIFNDRQFFHCITSKIFLYICISCCV